VASFHKPWGQEKSGLKSSKYGKNTLLTWYSISRKLSFKCEGWNKNIPRQKQRELLSYSGKRWSKFFDEKENATSAKAIGGKKKPQAAHSMALGWFLFSVLQALRFVWVLCLGLWVGLSGKHRGRKIYNFLPKVVVLEDFLHSFTSMDDVFGSGYSYGYWIEKQFCILFFLLSMFPCY
jgi:hypothetical protein